MVLRTDHNDPVERRLGAERELWGLVVVPHHGEMEDSFGKRKHYSQPALWVGHTHCGEL